MTACAYCKRETCRAYDAFAHEPAREAVKALLDCRQAMHDKEDKVAKIKIKWLGEVAFGPGGRILGMVIENPGGPPNIWIALESESTGKILIDWNKISDSWMPKKLIGVYMTRKQDKLALAKWLRGEEI